MIEVQAEGDRKREQTEDWIDYIIDKTHENYRGREIVIWGSYEAAESIKEGLEEKYGISTAFYVDSNQDKRDGKKVLSPDCLSGRAEQYYVVIPVSFYQSIREKLIQGGYCPDTDYYYFSDCILRQAPEYYEDAHGNKIIGKYEGLKFCFSGFRSVIEIGENVRFQDACFYIHNDSKVVIGDDAQFVESRIYIHHSAKAVFGSKVYLEKNEIILGDEAELEMKCGCNTVRLVMNIEERGKAVLDEEVAAGGRMVSWFIGKDARFHVGCRGKFYGGDGRCHLDKNAFLQIGKEFSINDNYRITLDQYTSIYIGDDCMFSNSISMRSHDGHSIFDIGTRENISSSYNISIDRKIIIGNHVWVGERAEILYHTRIGDGSIIGAMSLVKSRIPNNCIAAGIPARVIRKNIAWSRQYGAEDILECGLGYIHDTEE